VAYFYRRETTSSAVAAVSRLLCLSGIFARTAGTISQTSIASGTMERVKAQAESFGLQLVSRRRPHF